MDRIPTNGTELTEMILDQMKCDVFYLLDGNIIDIFEGIYETTGVDMLKEMDRTDRITYLFSNDVVIELLNRPGSINVDVVSNHVIHVNGGMNGKENRFLTEINGEVYFAYGNMVSTEDWGQIMVCQNHSRLKLVSNDVNLIRNAIRTIGEERTKTVQSLLQELLNDNPMNTNLKKVLKYVSDPKRSKKRIERGTTISWLPPLKA